MLEVLVVAALLIGLAVHQDWVELPLLDRDLRGSEPPAGVSIPDTDITGIQPSLPASRDMLGEPRLVVFSCVDCRSGDIVSGVLRRMDLDRVCDDTCVTVVGMGGSAPDWGQDGALGSATFHGTNDPKALSELRKRWFVGTESGVMFLYDADGEWRSTFHLGQMQPDDIDHDMRMLAQGL